MTDEKHLPVVAQPTLDSAVDVLREIVEYETKSAIELEALTGDEMPELPWMAKAEAVLAARPQAAPVETPFLIYLDEGDGLLHLKVGGVEITTASPNTSRGVALLKLENSVCRSSAETSGQEG